MPLLQIHQAFNNYNWSFACNPLQSNNLMGLHLNLLSQHFLFDTPKLSPQKKLKWESNCCFTLKMTPEFSRCLGPGLPKPKSFWWPRRLHFSFVPKSSVAKLQPYWSAFAVSQLETPMAMGELEDMMAHGKWQPWTIIIPWQETRHHSRRVLPSVQLVKMDENGAST